MAQVPNITASTTDFLLNVQNAAGQGTDNFILQINGFSENGVPITIPGLNTDFGLYIEGTVDVQGSPALGTTSVYGPGTIELVLDPTNNDGTPSATFDPTTQTGSIGFSNPAGTADDIVLATGNFVSGSFGTQSNGQPGVNFVETFQLNPAVFGPFLSHLSSSVDIEETLFNTATSRQAGSTASGGIYTTSNDGYGIVDFTAGSDPGGTSGNGGNGLPLLEPAILRAIAAELMSVLVPKVPGSLGGGADIENPSWAGASGVQDPVQTASWMHDLQSQVTHSS
jgi:hypothetical protein